VYIDIYVERYIYKNESFTSIAEEMFQDEDLGNMHLKKKRVKLAQNKRTTLCNNLCLATGRLREKHVVASVGDDE